MSLKFSEVSSWKIPEGQVSNVKQRDAGLPLDLLWDKIRYRYVSLGDSIAAGQRITEDPNMLDPACYAWQFGTSGNDSTTVIVDTYTDRIGKDIENVYTVGHTSTVSFARSSDKISDLMKKLDDPRVEEAIERAHLVTICIGANEILGFVTGEAIGAYALSGDLSSIETAVDNSLDSLDVNNVDSPYWKLFDKLTAINRNAEYVFTTIYNPYKYMHAEPGKDGFFKPVLDYIVPGWTIDMDEAIENALGFSDLGYPNPDPFSGHFGEWVSIELDLNVSDMIKNAIIEAPIFDLVFTRFNSLSSWVELRINRLNEILRSKMAAYKAAYPDVKFFLAETKTEFEKYPDRPASPVPGQVYYNDLVNVDFTRNQDVSKVNYGNMWGGKSPRDYFLGRAVDNMTFTNALPSLNVWDYYSFNPGGLANDVMNDFVMRVLVPDVDPHPEKDGHKALRDAFIAAVGDDFKKRGAV